MNADTRHSPRGVGIVLPGGGARGAYQAGSTLYLAEFLASKQMPIAAIAASSIGALNGAVLASAPSFLTGARTLVDLWRSIGSLPPAELQLFRRLPSIELGALLSFLLAAGESTSIDQLLREIGRAAGRAAAASDDESIAASLARALEFQPRVTINSTLHEQLKLATSVKALSSGIPLYVSVYPSKGAIMDAARFVLANLSSIDTAASQLIHVQSLPDNEVHDAILASAAIPFIFDGKELQGMAWSDGSLGGWRSQNGQVPAAELCNQIDVSALFVLHCSDASLWDRRASTLPPTIEVRPASRLGSGHVINDLFSADAETIEDRLERGYTDARRCISAVSTILGTFDAAATTRQRLRSALDDMEST